MVVLVPVVESAVTHAIGHATAISCALQDDRGIRLFDREFIAKDDAISKHLGAIARRRQNRGDAAQHHRANQNLHDASRGLKFSRFDSFGAAG
jgi:hypothetical protein